MKVFWVMGGDGDVGGGRSWWCVLLRGVILRNVFLNNVK